MSKRTSREISIHIQRSPGCAVTGSVPVFTYASLPPVIRQHAGVLADVGYMGYLAPTPHPAVSTPTEVCSFNLFGISNQVCSGVHATTLVLYCNSGRNDIGRFIDQAAHMNRQSATVHVIRLFA